MEISNHVGQNGQ